MSSLDITKKIAPITALRLLTLLQRIACLNALQEPAFFKQDFLAETYSWQIEISATQTAPASPSYLISQDIGPLKLPSYGLATSIFYNSFYTPLDNRSSFAKVTFQVALDEVRNRYNGAEFKLSVTPQASQDKINSYSFNPMYCLDRNTVLATANYFYNKPALYEKSYALLLENKSALSATLGTPFTEDLLLLFSAEATSEPVEAYAIPKGETAAVPFYYSKAFGCKKVGTAIIPLYLNGYIWLDLFVELNLTAANTLEFNLSLDKDTMHPEIKKCDLASGNVSKVQLLEIIDGQLNNWLENLEQRTNFAYKILAKLKTKILLEKI
jgi:hypothetical protein